MTTQSAIDLLEPATAFRVAGKYARQAQQYLAKPTWKDILEAQERNDFQLL